MSIQHVADREAMTAWAARVAEEHGKVNIIVNNAGVALGATVDGMCYAPSCRLASSSGRFGGAAVRQL